MSASWLQGVPGRWRAHGEGVVSVCSAHPTVIEASLKHLGERRLIEATCNQVNQEGGYTGLTPESFRKSVEALAARAGLDKADLALGGDHLGPNPWKRLPAEAAMQRAEAMVADYARAGFTKLHLDTSMPCAGDPPVLDEGLVAERAARLADAAFRAASAGTARRSPGPRDRYGGADPRRRRASARSDRNHPTGSRPEYARRSRRRFQKAWRRRPDRARGGDRRPAGPRVWPPSMSRPTLRSALGVSAKSSRCTLRSRLKPTRPTINRRIR